MTIAKYRKDCLIFLMILEELPDQISDAAMTGQRDNQTQCKLDSSDHHRPIGMPHNSLARPQAVPVIKQQQFTRAAINAQHQVFVVPIVEQQQLATSKAEISVHSLVPIVPTIQQCQLTLATINAHSFIPVLPVVKQQQPREAEAF